MFRRITAAAAIALGLTASVNAATLIIEYDANNAFLDAGTFKLPDSDSNSDDGITGTTLTANQGVPQTIAGRGITPANYGAPVYQPQGPGGAGPQERAFFSFDLYGLLSSNGVGADAFNNPGPAGYTMEMYVNITSGLTVIENSGIGFGQDTGGENQFLNVPNAGGLPDGTQNPVSLSSQTTTDNLIGGPQDINGVNQNVNAFLPRNQFIHLVKVHDAANEQVRWYLNGVVIAGLTQAFVENGLEYHPQGENLGNVGENGREVRGVQYSLTRFYRGALTDDEIYDRFVAVVPEPASMMMLAIGSMVIARRRRA